MSQRIRAFPWERTPLGPAAEWPQSLRTTLGLALASRQPMLILWGPQLIQLYNDAFRQMLAGERDPGALGADAREWWTGHRAVDISQIESVLSGKGAIWRDDELVPAERHGRPLQMWWSCSYLPIDDASAPNGIGGVLAMYSDVSERRFRALFDQASDFIFTADLDGRITSCNPALAQAIGFTREEILGRPLAEFAGPGDQECLRALLAREHWDQSAVRCEIEVSARNGQRMLWEINSRPILSAEGTPSGVQAIARDVTEQRQGESVLRESEARLREVVQSAPFPLMLHAEDGEVIELSRKWSELTGYQRSELATHFDWIRLAFAPETAAQLAPLIQAQFSATTSKRGGEWNVRTKDGQQRVWDFTSVPLGHLRDGRRLLLSAAVDVTDRNRAALLLASQKRVLELLASSAPLEEALGAIVQVIEEQSPDAVGTILLVNPDGKTLRHAAAPNLPESYSRAVDGLPIDCQLGVCPAAVATNSTVISVDIETDPRWDGIRQFPLALGLKAAWSVPIRGGDGKVLGTLSTYFREPRAPRAHERSVVEVLTGTAALAIERSAREQALRESEARFRNMADHSPVIVRVTEPDGRCSYLSRRWYELTGQSSEAALGRGWLEAVHPEDRPRIESAFTQAAQSREPLQVEYRLRRHDGEYAWVIDASIARFGADGEPLGYVGSIVDISDRKRIEEALHEADRRKDEFLATLAHELRNPLAPIRHAAAIAGSPNANEAQLEWSRGVIERQVKNMSLLLDDLLDVSRITRGKLTLKTQAVDLASVIDSAIETARPMLDSRRHHLQVDLPAQPLMLDADPLRLAQVLSNLLTNAAKYTNPNGWIRLSAREEGAEIVIRVTDNGIGIPADSLVRIFEMFSQSQPAMGRAEGGLGIGLALAKGLTRLHGGTIEARSAGLGQGSEFIVRLPRLQGAEASRTADKPARQSEPVRTGCRIIVADDNTDAATSLAMLLQLDGHEVHVAADGAGALEIAAKVRPDVMLLDIGMPGLNGYEVARRIREAKWGRPITLIAVTGWGQESDKRCAREAGFDHHLTKPVDPGIVHAMLAARSRPANA